MDAPSAASTSGPVRDADRVLTAAEVEEARLLAGILDGLQHALGPGKQASRGLAGYPAGAADAGRTADGRLPPAPASWEPPSITLTLTEEDGGLGAEARDEQQRPLEAALRQLPLEKVGRAAGFGRVAAKAAERLGGAVPEREAPSRPPSRVSAAAAEVTERLAFTKTESMVHAEAAELGADQPGAKPRQPFTYLRRRDPAPGARGGVQPKKPVGLLPFLRGTGTDYYGRRLDEILEWDFDRMEKVHNYIQWLFPTDEPSKFNRAAPEFTPELQAKVREDTVLQKALLKATRKFCAFLGLEMVMQQDARIVVQKGPHYEERVPTCWDTRFGGNHNWLRVSRVLHCLRLAGMDAEAAALHRCLEELYAEGVPCGVAMPHWRKRAATVGRPRQAPRRSRAGLEAGGLSPRDQSP